MEQSLWTPAMQEAWNDFSFHQEVSRAYGRPLPPFGKTYPPPSIHSPFFAAFVFALSSAELRDELIRAEYESMEEWKARLSPSINISSLEIDI